MSFKDTLKRTADTVKGIFTKTANDLKNFIIPVSVSSLYPVSKFADYNSYLSAAQIISWVYKCVSIVGENVATTDGWVYDNKDNEVEDDVLDQLLTNPNEWMSWYEFKEAMLWYLWLTGNVYILKDEINMLKQPTKMYLLRPDRMQIIPSKTKFIAGYQYDLDGKKIPFSVDEIIHLKLPNPRNLWYGMGKIEACKIVYDTEIAASTYNWNFFNHGAAPAAILTNEGTLDDDSYRRLSKQFEVRHVGFKKMQRPLLLEKGTQYKQLGLSQQDMGFFEQRKFTREEILSIFGVPPAKAGILEYASFANTKEQENTFRKDTLKPLLVRIENMLTQKLVHLFNPNWHYEFEEVVERDEEMYMKLATQGIATGLISPNEARVQYLELPLIKNEPAMDSNYMPLSLMPITGEPAVALQASIDAEATPEEEEEEEEKHAKCTHTKLTQVNSQKAVNIQQALLKLATLTKQKLGVKLKDTSKKYFKQQTEKILAKLDELDKEKKLIVNGIKRTDFTELFDDPDDFAAYQKSMEQISVNIALTSLDNVSGIMQTEEPANPLDNPKFKEQLGKLGKRIKGINDTTLNQLDTSLNEGLSNGESIPDLKKRVQKIMTNRAGWEATRIARTESAFAYDRGAIYGYDLAGVKFLDVIGCTMIEPEWDCGRTNVPISEAYGLDFHPNHTGTVVPSFGAAEF